MPKYQFKQDYRAVLSTSEGEIVLSYKKGDKVDFSAEEAARIMRDSAGALKQVRAAKPKRTRQLVKAPNERAQRSER